MVVGAALTFAACLPAPKAHGSLLARVTWYRSTGSPTASGLWPYPGSAACSYDLPLFVTITLYGENGPEQFDCIDRGLLFPGPWIDLYERPDAANTFGDYAPMELP